MQGTSTGLPRAAHGASSEIGSRWNGEKRSAVINVPPDAASWHGLSATLRGGEPRPDAHDCLRMPSGLNLPRAKGRRGCCRNQPTGQRQSGEAGERRRAAWRIDVEWRALNICIEAHSVGQADAAGARRLPTVHRRREIPLTVGLDRAYRTIMASPIRATQGRALPAATGLGTLPWSRRARPLGKCWRRPGWRGALRTWHLRWARPRLS